MEENLQTNKPYYFMCHAYHHFVGVLKKTNGKRMGYVTKLVRIQSCKRGWDKFFEEGMMSDTKYARFPDGELTWFAAFEWNHPLPEGPCTLMTTDNDSSN